MSPPSSIRDELRGEAQAEAGLSGLREIAKRDAKIRELRKLLKESEKHVVGLQAQVDVRESLRESDTRPIVIPKRKAKGKRDPHTFVALASDWHSAELVNPAEIGGLNRHDPDVGEERAYKYARDVAKMCRSFQDKFTIDDVVLCLMGDFMVNDDLHDESPRCTDLSPLNELRFVKRLLIGTIDHLLSELDVKKIRIPCVPGNHGRSTKKTVHRRQEDYSYEHHIYGDLAEHYAKEPRLDFDISPMPHKTFQAGPVELGIAHGDRGMTYGGGISGLAIPFAKAVNVWHRRTGCKLWSIGHYHQRGAYPIGFTNGSLVGPNAYARDHQFDLERPSQWVYLVDHERADIGTCAPIWVD